MCGFVAYVGRTNLVAPLEIIPKMLRVIAHRGPDDEGTYYTERVGFGFRRLAILDLSPAGHQPMSDPTGLCTIVFNGEIYNYVELRKELSSLGHSFVSGTDTEVLLHAYLEWGDSFMERLNGMWAFLIHDRRTGRVFGSRDRFGMKPLFIHDSNDGFLIASELKSIRASGSYRDTLNLGVCARFFHESRLDNSESSFFDGIHSIKPGHALEIDVNGKLRTWCYWHVQRYPDAPDRPGERYAELFEQAVSVHMRSDVALGVNLSGGMDSTAIICAIARQWQPTGSTQPLRAFSFAADGFDESRYIDATLAQTHAQRETLSLSPMELWNSLDTVLWYQDEPVHSLTAVVGFHLSGLAARNGVKVILNGQGADETLAGYPTYFRDYWYSLLIKGRLPMLLGEVGSFCAMHGGSRTSRMIQAIKHAAQTELRKSPRYRAMARRRRLTRFLEDDWYDPELANALPEADEFEAADLDSSLERSILYDPLPLYLRVEDRNAMAHSVEARLPFLDPRLVELAFSLPPEWKMRGGWNKFILREAMKGRIPDVVRTRPDKMGFPTPFSKWLQHELYASAKAVIEDRSLADLGLFRIENIRRDLERHRRGELDIAGKLFDVMQFAIWRRLKPSEPPSLPAAGIS